MNKEIAKQLVDKYIKSFGDTEIPIDEMYYNESKSDGIMMRNFLEDFAEDILNQQTKELQEKVECRDKVILEYINLRYEDTIIIKQLQAKIDELENEIESMHQNNAGADI